MIRILLVADTHLGFDLPARPRVDRRRRGDDFFRNFEQALEPARDGRADIVVHGGDVFHRSRVPAGVVSRAIELIHPVIERGIPFVIVPGNHERSSLPLSLLWDRPGVHVFDHPRTFRFTIRGVEVSLAGFPFCRRSVRDGFATLVASAEDAHAAVGDAPPRARLLCMHQAVEGATVGAQDYTFRSGHDVVPGNAIPPGFAAILSGHIHRAQVLRRDLSGRALPSPVIYPGSIERTAFAERLERKGCVHLVVAPDATGGTVERCGFRELPARPMERISLDAGGLGSAAIRECVAELLRGLAPDAIVTLLLAADPDAAVPSVASIRAVAPRTMNIDVRVTGRHPSTIGG